MSEEIIEALRHERTALARQNQMLRDTESMALRELNDVRRENKRLRESLAWALGKIAVAPHQWPLEESGRQHNAALDLVRGMNTGEMT